MLTQDLTKSLYQEYWRVVHLITCSITMHTAKHQKNASSYQKKFEISGYPSCVWGNDSIFVCSLIYHIQSIKKVKNPFTRKVGGFHKSTLQQDLFTSLSTRCEEVFHLKSTNQKKLKFIIFDFHWTHEQEMRCKRAITIQIQVIRTGKLWSVLYSKFE